MDQTLLITGFQALFGIIVLFRLLYNIRERINIYHRFHRLPSQTTYLKFTFEGMLGIFIIFSAAIWANLV